MFLLASNDKICMFDTHTWVDISNIYCSKSQPVHGYQTAPGYGQELYHAMRLYNISSSLNYIHLFVAIGIS